MTRDQGSRRRKVATAAGLTVGAAAYVLTLLDYGLRLTRTANALGYASNFFDGQGRSLLDGHLWVPNGFLGIEAFVERGHDYMYFPPWPAIIRMPILSMTNEFDGKLTLLSMALGFVLMMVMSAKLVWLVRDQLAPGPVSRLEAVVMGALIALVTGGTTLTYVASLPWAFHEVYAWSIPFTVGSMYWLIRVLDDPTRRAVCWLAAFVLGTLLTRTTDGWAMAVAAMAAGVWLLVGRLHRDRRRFAIGTIAAGVVPLVIGIVINVLKFRHPFLFPLEDQVWTQLNAHRREALDANGGTLTGLQFFPTSFMAYFRLDGVRFVDYFPWVTLPAHAPRAYDGAVLDQTYRTGSVTGFMPWPLLLTVLTAIAVFRPGVDRARRILRVPLVGGVLATGGVMGYGYLAHRYTSEFVPALVLGATVGTVLAFHWLRRRRAWLAGLFVAVTAAFTVFGLGANMLIGYTAAAYTGGGPQLERYVALQHRLSPHQQAERTTISDDLPSGGRTDDLWIRGDCDALYLNTGDRYEPWQLVQQRAVVVQALVADDAKAGVVRLIEVDSTPRRSVSLLISSSSQARVMIDTGDHTYFGQWFDLLEPRTVRVGVRPQPELGYAEVSSTPGGFVGFLPVRESDEGVVRLLDLTPSDDRKPTTEGVTVRTLRGVEPPLCRDLMAATRK
ncbi:hypothetical protein [Nocardioides conyzicola]|uniref:Glycosyltransferase RgtA/B/C/D-like domain-containing protein n=1 Tax=Nocardioides conyzicola TaxID=1651781 RepID=A0ABP8Y426_9ACTN